MFAFHGSELLPKSGCQTMTFLEPVIDNWLIGITSKPAPENLSCVITWLPLSYTCSLTSKKPGESSEAMETSGTSYRLPVKHPHDVLSYK